MSAEPEVLFARIQSRLGLLRVMGLSPHSPAEAVVASDCIAILAAALADARREQEWQPIASAPKDKQALFFEWFDAGPEYGILPRVYVGQWWKGNKLNRADWTDSSQMYAQPTHWMPLLPAPKATEARHE